MSKKEILSGKISALLFFVTFIIPLTACAGMKKDSSSEEKEPVQASVVYLYNGEIIVKDGNGRVIQPTQIKFPLDVKQIESIQSSVSITIRGSHYMLKQIGDKIYKIPLAH